MGVPKKKSGVQPQSLALVFSVDLLTSDWVTHSAGKALPRCLLRHAECFADLSPALSRLSCLADRLPHRLSQSGLCPAAFTQGLNRMGFPVSERPQAQTVPMSDDPHTR
jgi:hypothetical protein